MDVINMKISVNGKEYEVIIDKKMSTRNTYLRVKEDLKIHVTTNLFTPNKEIERIIVENQSSIVRMINKMEKKVDKNANFYYLGKKYDIIYTSTPGVTLGQEKVFISRESDLDKWYKKQASILFQQHLDECYNKFTRKIPYPTLTIRKMTSRWGVCNTKNHRVTLNLELMKKPIYCLDYVIMHELSHLIYPNHSRDFWGLVEENCPYFKDAKKTLKE